MSITTKPDVGAPPRVFLPESFDPADTLVLAETGAALLDRPLLSPLELENWLIDWSELKATIFGERARRHIARSLDTRDDSLRDASLRFEQEVVPVWKRIEDRLARRLLGCEHRHALDERFHVLLRRAESDAALFREANLELEAREKELVTEYETITGGSMVRFRGEELTLSQCATHLRDEDRAVREAAWRAMQETRLAERERLDSIFDGLLGLRNRIGSQADCADGYREWCFRAKYRFDYGPAECEAFHRAVEAVVVPAVRELRRQRREALGLETLRPWDLEVDPTGASRTQPVEDEAGFAALGASLFEAVDPALAADFDILVRNDLLDLMSRPGKAPGGFCAMIGDIRLPFIFQNSVGRHSDLMTLLHEGGHAFHAVASRQLPVIDLGRAPMEFCEVASMAMEMFGLERLDRVYDAGQASWARRSTLERRLGIFGWIATARKEGRSPRAGSCEAFSMGQSFWADLSLHGS